MPTNIPFRDLIKLSSQLTSDEPKVILHALLTEAGKRCKELGYWYYEDQIDNMRFAISLDDDDE